MTLSLLLQMIFASLSATVIYTFISFIPGTDETSVLMPISMALILSKINPILALTFFVSAVVTLGLLNIVLTLIAGVPGGVLSTPIVEHALTLKSNGRTAVGIKKAAVGSLIGVAISLPLSLLIANFVAPYAVFLKNYASWLFILGAIFLSLISKAKILSLISIIPMAILFQGLRSLYWSLGIVPESKIITTSFFLGITVAPLILSLFSLLNKKELDQVTVETPNTTVIPEVSGQDTSLNPLGILNKQELKSTGFFSFFSTFLFVLSPVGLIILFGEMTGKRKKTKLEKSESSIVTMSALAQSTYLSGLIISIVALGIPLAPSAIGPGAAFFEAPPVFTIGNTITNQLPRWQLILAFVIGACIAFAIVYCIAMKFATRITRFVMQHVPHEAILALFVALVILLAYLDAGLLNVFGVFLISFACGTLNKLGVNYGIQFMTLYAAPFLLSFF